MYVVCSCQQIYTLLGVARQTRQATGSLAAGRTFHSDGIQQEQVSHAHSYKKGMHISRPPTGGRSITAAMAPAQSYWSAKLTQVFD